MQIPVYRCSFDSWVEDEQRRRAPHIRVQTAAGRTDADAAIIAARITGGQSWDFNEVAAWIKVFGFHDVVKAELWLRRGERMHRHPTQPFEWLGKLSEHWIEDESNEEIGASVRSMLVEQMKNTPSLRRRHLDLRAFDQLAPFLDWRSALGAPVRQCVRGFPE